VNTSCHFSPPRIFFPSYLLSWSSPIANNANSFHPCGIVRPQSPPPPRENCFPITPSVTAPPHFTKHPELFPRCEGAHPLLKLGLDGDKIFTSPPLSGCFFPFVDTICQRDQELRPQLVTDFFSPPISRSLHHCQSSSPLPSFVTAFPAASSPTPYQNPASPNGTPRRTRCTVFPHTFPPFFILPESNPWPVTH